MNNFDTNYSGEKREYGVHRGIVINTDDPTYKDSGRVQVFVPDLFGYDLGGILGSGTSFKFKFPGDNLTSNLTSDVIDYLKTICPWALPAFPIQGDEGPGIYDASTGQASTTENIEYGNVGSQTLEQLSFPAVQYEYNPPSDPFVDPYSAVSAEANVYGYDYGAPSYSNQPKGSFGVPRVGAYVLVSFFRGDVNFPVYHGYMPSVTDVKSIFNSVGTNTLYKSNYDSVYKKQEESISDTAADQITINKTLRGE
jgi:hypothetical protein